MPLIYITKTLGPRTVKGSIKNWTRKTINRISQEHGSHGWYEEHQPRPLRRAALELAQERRVASAARKLAEASGVDLDEVAGTGKGGSVKVADVEAFIRNREKSRESASAA